MIKEKILTKNFCFAFLSLLSSSMVMYMLMATTAAVTGLVSAIYVVGGMFSRLASGKCLETIDWKRVGLAAGGLTLLALPSFRVIERKR